IKVPENVFQQTNNLLPAYPRVTLEDHIYRCTNMGILLDIVVGHVLDKDVFASVTRDVAAYHYPDPIEVSPLRNLMSIQPTSFEDQDEPIRLTEEVAKQEQMLVEALETVQSLKYSLVGGGNPVVTQVTLSSYIALLKYNLWFGKKSLIVKTLQY